MLGDASVAAVRVALRCPVVSDKKRQGHAKQWERIFSKSSAFLRKPVTNPHEKAACSFK